MLTNFYRVGQKTGLFFESLKLPYMLTQNSVLYTKLFSILFRVRLVYYMSLYLNILAQFQCNDTALKITTNFSDDVHFLPAVHLKFTINTNFVYIPVEATVSTSTACPNHYSQYYVTRMIYRSFYFALTLIPDKHFNRTHFR